MIMKLFKWCSLNLLFLSIVKSDTVKIVQDFAESHKMTSITIFSTEGQENQVFQLGKYYTKNNGKQDNYIEIIPGSCDHR